MEKNIQILCLLIILFILYEYGFKESMVSHKIKEKEFQVYDKFQNYDIAGKLLYDIDARILKLLDHLDTKYIKTNSTKLSNTLKNRLKKMITQYKTNHLKENFPSSMNIGGKKPDSSFTLNKKNMAICLRDDHTKQFHDINDIMFVCIHEMAHIINPTYGHPKSFWLYMKFLLHESVEIGIYIPKNYGKKNIKYCNTFLKANPYYYNMDCDSGIPHVCP